LLKAVTSAIARSVRATDWIARYGGEELCAVLPDTSLEPAVVIAERILAEIRLVKATSVDGRSFGATASGGVVVTRGEDAGVPEFLQRASDKVREAKKAGKNNVAR
jgi:diguanylate cyclase (GGDEF)-like protein